MFGLCVELEVDRLHLTDRDAVKVDRRTGQQAAQRLGEIELHRQHFGVGVSHRGSTIADQIERGFRRRRFCRQQIGRRLKRNAAGDDRSERRRVDFYAGRIQRDVDAARMPETGIRRDVLIVRRVHEHLQRDAPTVGIERERHHLTDLDAPVIKRRTDTERTDFVAAQARIACPARRPSRSAALRGRRSCGAPYSTCRRRRRDTNPKIVCPVR